MGDEQRIVRPREVGVDAPIAITENSSQVFGFDPKHAGDKYLRFANEAYRFMIGPMPVKDFLEEFMERSRIMGMRGNIPMPDPRDAFSQVPVEPAKEEDIYNPLIQALNAGRCPNYTFMDTSAKPDTSHGAVGAIKPDICAYHNTHVPLIKRKEKKKQEKEKDTKKGKSETFAANMGYAQIFFEVKRQKAYDPFVDPPPECKSREEREFILGHFKNKDNLKKARESLGQNIAYAAEIMARQFRHACYSVCVHGAFARLIRWDRAGAIVSEAFSLRENPEFLCEFVWCFSHLSEAAKGFDLSVAPATKEEAKRFHAAIRQHVQHQYPELDEEGLKTAIQEHVCDDVTVLLVPDSSDKSGYRQLLVSRPIVYPLSVTGRATRGYWALDKELGRIVFIKDTWRYDAEITGCLEWSVLRELDKLETEIINIPRVISFGDVPKADYKADVPDVVKASALHIEYGSPQTTLTQTYLQAPWLCDIKRVTSPFPRTSIVKHTHSRFTLDIAGYPLLRFQGTSELLHVTHDILKAMAGIYAATRRLHRDITPSNIVLYRDGGTATIAHRTGYLVDWDLSSIEGWAPQPDYQHALSAAWQFQSMRLQNDLSRNRYLRYFIQDDMESLVWVVIYCCLVWLPHSAPPSSILRQALNSIFDVYQDLGDAILGSQGKSMEIYYRTYTRLIEWKSAAVNEWIEAVLTRLQPYVHWRNVVDSESVENSDDSDHVHEWTPHQFMTWWEEFLLAKSAADMPTSDRCAELPSELLQHGLASLTIRQRPFMSTRTSPVSTNPRKRKAFDASLSDTPSSRCIGSATVSYLQPPPGPSDTISTRLSLSSTSRHSPERQITPIIEGHRRWLESHGLRAVHSVALFPNDIQQRRTSSAKESRDAHLSIPPPEPIYADTEDLLGTWSKASVETIASKPTSTAPPGASALPQGKMTVSIKGDGGKVNYKKW